MSGVEDTDLLQLFLARMSSAGPPLPPLPSAAARAAAALPAAVAALPYAARLRLAAAAALASVVALSAVRARLRAGAPRLAAVAPLLVLNACLPLLFRNEGELLSRVTASFVFTWLANFKAFGLAVNRGPLAMADWRLPQLLLLYLMPIYPREAAAAGSKGRLGDSAGPARKLLLRFLGQTALFIAVALLLVDARLPDMLRYYALGLYGFISFLMNGPALLLTSLAGLEMVPSFDAPWKSASLAEFWARRWNNVVGLTLRSVCYDPIIEGCLIKPEAQPEPEPAKPGQLAPPSGGDGGDAAAAAAAAARPARASRARTTAATAAVFFASGVAHEVVLAYILQPYAPLLQLESSVLRALKARGIRPPWLARFLVTQAVLLVCAHHFFFPPLERHTRTAQRVCDAIVGHAQGLADAWAAARA
ncbi:hypothetical protein Rsub_06870 [Raphidocelis subcapitata]|uniref:Wax synthase domain-containing protein n=1 Tax=Raphidocelis subcapitata TaxID=307507 RepID=A0A2V0P1W3_9CHLO|nr:hypothetical protein Rsub_06870 [Raphidocelis subcapitata]|eukprot:GBF93871.1 hypothetical protein Rsub_06870 [Raphidocelis subcapitata]